MGKKKKTGQDYETRVVAPTGRDPVPVVRLAARKCRKCGSTNVKADGGSHVSKGGVRVLYCVCRDCGAINRYYLAVRSAIFP